MAKVDRKTPVSLGIVIAVLGALASAFIWIEPVFSKISHHDARLDEHKDQIDYLHDHNKEVRANLKEIRASLHRIEGHLKPKQ